MTTPRKPKASPASSEEPTVPTVPPASAQTPDNDRVTAAIRAVLSAPVAPCHKDLTNWAIGDLLVTIQTLQAELPEAYPDLKIRIARELSQLHRSLHQWSCDPQGQTKANPLSGK